MPGEHFEDSGLEPFVRIGAGVSVEHALGPPIAAGLLAEGGMTLARAAKVELDPTDAPDIPTHEASLGQLALSGPYLRFAALVRF